jgi:hypothetical protein
MARPIVEPGRIWVKAADDEGNDPKPRISWQIAGTLKRTSCYIHPDFNMPILVRPVREQLEHDRVIRLLQAKYKRKFDVGMNPGAEQSAPVGVGTSAVYPDLVLQSPERSRKLLGVVEVETGESVNNLEAMAQWVAFGRLRAPFHLYVPSSMIDVARRLCQDLQVPVAEIWTYHPVGDQMRFTLVQRAPGAPPEKAPRAASLEPRRAPARPEPSRASHPEPSRATRPEPSRTARPEPSRGEPVRAARSENGAAAPRPARSRPVSTAAARRKPATKARAAKAAPTRGRSTATKKKTAPARSGRTQKRK